MAYLKDGVVCYDDIFNVTVQTDAEKAQRLAEVAEAKAKENDKAKAKQAVLTKLGLTADEVTALLG